DSYLILRSKALKECFEPRRPRLRIETKHAISLLRPVPDFARRRRPRPTAGVAEPLCFCEIGFALAPGRFRQFPLDSDAREMSNVRICVLLQRTGATRLAIVHGKCPDHFSFGGKDRRRPTRAT